MWISAYPRVEIDDFLKVLHLVWAWDFVDMYLTHLGIWRGSFHIYLRKWFFWTSKDCCPHSARAEKTFFFFFECYALTMVRNESVRFGRHIDIELSYKILWLEIPKLVQICTIWLAFKRGCLEAILSKNTLRPLGVKSWWPTFMSKDLAELPNRAQPMFLVPKPKFKKSD
jgi:hypothetical protein